jgi:hypothetical protein
MSVQSRQCELNVNAAISHPIINGLLFRTNPSSRVDRGAHHRPPELEYKTYCRSSDQLRTDRLLSARIPVEV